MSGFFLLSPVCSSTLIPHCVIRISNHCHPICSVQSITLLWLPQVLSVLLFFWEIRTYQNILWIQRHYRAAGILMNEHRYCFFMRSMSLHYICIGLPCRRAAQAQQSWCVFYRDSRCHRHWHLIWSEYLPTVSVWSFCLICWEEIAFTHLLADMLITNAVHRGNK